MLYKKLKMWFLIGAVINIVVGCSSWKTVSLNEYKKVEQLRGQPPEIYVWTSDHPKLFLFSHSNYYIQNDTLFGKDHSGKQMVLTNIKSIQYNYEIEQDVEVYYDSEKDSVVGYKYTGAEAYIKMNDGTDYTGEILIVRDSIMIVCEEYEADEQELADSVYTIYILNNSDIELIELYIGNYLIAGIYVGGLTGGLIGTAINVPDVSKPKPSSNNHDGWHYNFSGFLDFPDITGSCLGGAIGALIGGIIGSSITDDDIVYEYAEPEEYDFKTLNIYARYVNNEPDFLKKIK